MIVEVWRRNFEDERIVIEFSIVTYLTLKGSVWQKGFSSPAQITAKEEP
ncbi:hypothetical protein Lser_V15G27305 [Lactuca serriola]